MSVGDLIRGQYLFFAGATFAFYTAGSDDWRLAAVLAVASLVASVYHVYCVEKSKR